MRKSTERNPARRAGGKNWNSGFTLLETLIVVCILVILLGISMVRAVHYRDYLKIAELDNAARDISMAAQNRAVLLQNSGRLDGLLRGHDLTPPGGYTNGGTYYIRSDADVLDELVPEGTIDPTLRDRGEFFILYEPESASVTDVFYMEEKDKVSISDALGLIALSNHRDARMNNRDAGGNPAMVGYYGSGKGEAINTRPLPTPGVEVSIDNGSNLTLTVKYSLPAEALPAGTKRIPSVKLEYGGKVAALLAADSEGHITTADDDKRWKYQGWSAGGGSPVLKAHIVRSDIIAAEYTWTLDSLKNEVQFKGLDFKNPDGTHLASDLSFGGDFTVTASLTLQAPGCIDSAYYARGKDNSLFASGTTADTAWIANLRHLQNLDAGGAGHFTSGVSDGIENAVQLCDIDCAKDGDDRAYNFCPIKNDKLKSYDGKGYDISNLSADSPDRSITPDRAGLFYELAGGITVKGVRLVDATVYGSSAGALAAVASNAVLDDIRVYWSSAGKTAVLSNPAYKVTGTADAGGLAGQVTGSVTVSNSFAATTVEGANAGGLFGSVSASGSLSLDGSYADCYLKGTNAAGLVGRNDSTASVSLTNCYAAGFIVDPADAANTAGLVGGGASVTSGGAYSAVRLLKTADNSLDQPGTLLAGGLEEGGGARYLYKKEDVTSTNLSSVLGGGFKALPADKPETSVYNLRNKLKAAAAAASAELAAPYVFPSLGGLPHYGDWAELEPPILGGFGSGFAYYEKYEKRDDEGNRVYTYGVEAFCEPETANEPTFNSLKEDKDNPVVVRDGYALVLTGDIAPVSVTYGGKEWRFNASETWTMTSGYTGTAPTSTVEPFTLTQGGEKYTLVPLPVPIMTGKLPDLVVWADDRIEARHFYQRLTVQSKPDGSDAEKTLNERVFYFNPHFGRVIKTGATVTETVDGEEKAIYKTPEQAAGKDGNVVGYLDGLEPMGDDPGRRILIRTPRHLYNLSAFQRGVYCYIYAAHYHLYFRQELDLDYSTYQWYGTIPEKDEKTGHVRQDPIGYGSVPFDGAYDGQYHMIKNVFFTDDKTETDVGLFGKITLKVENVIYQQDSVLDESKPDTANPDWAHTGLLVGLNEGGLVKNCAVYGVNVKMTGGGRIGGLVGTNNGNIQKCAVELVNLTVTGASGGGLVGYNAGSIGQSYAVGRMTGAGGKIGGLAAENVGGIGNSYAAVDLVDAGGCKRYGLCLNVSETSTTTDPGSGETTTVTKTGTSDPGWLGNINIWRGQLSTPGDYDNADGAILSADLKASEERDTVRNIPVNPTTGEKPGYAGDYEGQPYPYRPYVTTMLKRNPDTGAIIGPADKPDTYVHYGLWPISVPVGVAYYEKYEQKHDSKSFGIQGYCQPISNPANAVSNLTDSTPRVVLDGYAMVFEGASADIPEGSYEVRYGSGETERIWNLTKSLESTAEGTVENYNWTRVGDTAQNVRPVVFDTELGYTLIPLPDDINNGELAERVIREVEETNDKGEIIKYNVDQSPFYQLLRFGRQDYYFNPYFGATVRLPNWDGARPANPISGVQAVKDEILTEHERKDVYVNEMVKDQNTAIRIRSPRHFYNLSTRPLVNGNYYYLQELDLDYTVYRWADAGLTPESSGGSDWKYYKQPPVSIRDKLGTQVSFTYDGGCHIISGVLFDGADIINRGASSDKDYCTGLFAGVWWKGDVCSIIKNVVYKMDANHAYVYDLKTDVNTATDRPLVMGLLVGSCAGQVRNCAVWDVNLEVNVDTSKCGSNRTIDVGGLVGRMRGCVQNCSVELAELKVDPGPSGHAGGLVGRLANNTHLMTGDESSVGGGQIFRSYAVGNLTGWNRNGILSGLVGYYHLAGTIRDCYAAMYLGGNGAEKYGFGWTDVIDSTKKYDMRNCWYLQGNFAYRKLNDPTSNWSLNGYDAKEISKDAEKVKKATTLNGLGQNFNDIMNPGTQGGYTLTGSAVYWGNDANAYPFPTSVKTNQYRGSDGKSTGGGWTDPAMPVHYGQWPK